MPFDQPSADFVCDFLECLTIPDGVAAGQPMRLFDWQRDILTQFYGEMDDDGLRRYRYLYLELPKKNGKSGLASGLGLYHTFADGEIRGEVYVVAADRDNAGIVFGSSLAMLDACPSLKKRAQVIPSQKIIRDRISGTVYRVLSAEAYSKHGYKPSCVIFDELHAQPNRELWDIMTVGAGDARAQPVWIVLTTAGNDPDRNSIGWEVHQKAKDILAARAGDPEKRDNPTWLPVIYGYDGDDIWNEQHWIEANPSIDQGAVTLKAIRLHAEDAKQSEAGERLFRWLRLNQWIATKDVGWIPLTLWDACAADFAEAEMDGLICYMGLDLSATTDLTALVTLFPPQGGCPRWRRIVRAWIPEKMMREREKLDHVPYGKWLREEWICATPGGAVDYTAVEQEILTQNARFRVKALGADQWNSRHLTQRLMAAGMEVFEVPQTVGGMSPAMKEMERMMRAGEIQHRRNPVDRWNFGNVRAFVDGNENMKPMKNKSTGRIDLAVASINALATARAMGEKSGGYAEHLPRFITFDE